MKCDKLSHTCQPIRSSGKLTIGTLAEDSYVSGELHFTEDQPVALVLWGAAVGPNYSGMNVTLPSGAGSTAEAGLIYGYKGPGDYWVRCYNMDQHLYVYHVVNGTRNTIQIISMTVTTGTAYSLNEMDTQTYANYPSNFSYTDGYPGGKIGVYSNVAGATFDTPTAVDNPRPYPLYGRWDGVSVTANAYGMILQSNPIPLQGPTYLKNLRLQKFQATFALGTYDGGGGANAATFVFNGTDRDNYDALQLFAGTSSYTPNGFECEGGYPGWPMSGTYSAGPAAPDYGWMWFRVQFDGTTLKVWQILGTGTTPPSDWSSATQVVSVTGCHTTGGRIGFANNYSGIPTNVNFLTINSWNPTGGGGSGAFDITEATDNFTIDGSGNGNNTLASDSNGNQVYDGSQFYTYDGWNRLITVSHGYRNTSGNLQHGQASVTNSYDAKGRRITKVVNNTGSWDCSYNYYYNGNRQIEQQNGSNRTIRQNVWGLGYIDNLIQTSLNSDPADQSNCDTPYWVLQDANYNVLGILNSSGVLVERYEYSAYGQRTVYFSPGSNDPFCMAPTVSSQRFVASTGTEAYGLCEFGHQGLMHDEECGLVYNRARYLSPILERFISRDLIEYRDGLDLYQYVDSNPISRTDYLGTETRCCNPDGGCTWNVTIEASSYLGLWGHSYVKVTAAGRDSGGCAYNVEASGTSWRAFGSGIGHYTMSGSTSGLKGKCKWPINKGSELSINWGSAGVGIPIHTAFPLEISGTWSYYTGGDLHWESGASLGTAGGVYIQSPLMSGSSISVSADDVKQW